VPIRDAIACFSTPPRTDCDAGAIWAPVAIAPKPPVIGPARCRVS